jgi:hypothetical protein
MVKIVKNILKGIFTRLEVLALPIYATFGTSAPIFVLPYAT